eukprot:CAMPEP_0176355120 /NCGR_PEP_ID=MMETSP0126-20121128/13066_1 /TAXON_ID=141414 ORGANISM="Strombidinopsis acuminatum, Strain SPMC142" /NCGR_SAMPLE_ID=MMETSP0126 /ASSEMBLY_ACC=CAM_ASM_000229 /LENGTH=78 /DNA_ID=CAMNT_0017707631 /DNA_START=67 /DNA_END=303 /DNA_ORIENTATION=+
METDLSAKAEAKKNEGNVEFKKGNYRDAIQHYSEAIDIEPSAPILSNRAASYIALKEYTKAIDDAKRAIHMDEKFAKA